MSIPPKVALQRGQRKTRGSQRRPERPRATLAAETTDSFSALSRSPRQTLAWGRRLGQFFKGGEIVGLVGELGSGKTCFVRGMSQGLDVAPDAWIRSPSFTLINEYHGRLAIYHIDLYRIERAAEMEELNLREYLFSEGVSVIEWFDRLPRGEAEEYLKIEFAPVDRSRRRLTFTARGAQYKKILGDLKKGSPAATKVKG